MGIQWEGKMRGEGDSVVRENEGGDRGIQLYGKMRGGGVLNKREGQDWERVGGIPTTI
jgi:hypothetical protein